MRVHELAKELDLSSKELLSEIEHLDMPVKSHMSALKEDQVQRIREAVEEARAKREAEAARAAEQSAAEAEQAEPAAPVEEEAKPPAEPEEPEETGPPTVSIKGPVVVKEFADTLGLRPNQLITELMGMNIFASINQKIEQKIAQKIAEKHGFEIEKEKKPPEPKPAPAPKKKEKKPEPEPDRADEMVERPPVVTFLGHVDHGKTSLLDHIRKARVAAGEAGGITQAIGAYSVDYNDRRITFIDTPGHAAFTAMRARGANLTDIAILVIAADDGMMPQTREALRHAQAADVTMMVAINKCDLPGANPDRVKQQLQQEGLTPEDWGGELICCEVSAATGDGIDDMLEMILLQSEILELKANPRRPAQGFVIEAQLEPGMGPTANILIKRGTLKVGDALICGPHWGKVKALIDDRGKKLRTAGPSTAVKCLGLNSVPEAGMEFEVCGNDREAKSIAQERSQERRSEELGSPARKASLDDLLNQTDTTSLKELNVVVKADTQGSAEAIEQALKEIESDKVALKIVMSGVGNITVNDVLLASASDAIVLGFHVGKEGQVTSTAKREGVEIRLYSIIYELLDNVRQAMTGLLEPEYRERVLGHAEIKQVFDLSRRARAAGCLVTDGRITSTGKARIMRGRDVVYEGSLASLKRFQNDASEVREGQECGIRVDNFTNFEAGDVIEVYTMDKLEQKL